MFFRLLRCMARKQLNRLHGMGYKLLSGFENEFILFKEGTRETVCPGLGFMLTSSYAKTVSSRDEEVQS